MQWHYLKNNDYPKCYSKVIVKCEEDEYEDDSDMKIRNYYDSMREEFDPSYDEHYDPWSDESDK